MAFKGFSGLSDANLRFVNAGGGAVGLYRYLQGFFGQTYGVIRKVGSATVLSGATTVDVTDAKIAATDEVLVTAKTKGTNACVVTSVVITAATKFRITVDTDPGAGGQAFSYVVIRPVSQT